MLNEDVLVILQEWYASVVRAYLKPYQQLCKVYTDLELFSEKEGEV